MKTDLTEIFQTIRASLQPYATQGYTVHESSETGYDLYSEKNMVENGESLTERFFAGVYINGNEVELKLNEGGLANLDGIIKFSAGTAGLKFNGLDDEQLKNARNLIEIVNAKFKEKEWI